jgi:hypothetical protein
MYNLDFSDFVRNGVEMKVLKNAAPNDKFLENFEKFVLEKFQDNAPI